MEKTVTNVELFKLFQNCKKTRFDKEPDFDLVAEEVCQKLHVSLCDTLMNDIRSVFSQYKIRVTSNASIRFPIRNLFDTS